MTQPTVTRSAGAADIDAIEAAYAAEGLKPHRWSSEPGDRYAAHEHVYAKVLYCLRGSITFTLPRSGEAIDLAPGDRLDLPAGTPHGALVGAAGVECIEAARPASREDKG